MPWLAMTFLTASRPSGPYLRARYGEQLPEDAMKALSDMFDVLSSQYQPNDDEASDEVEDSPANGRGGSLR